MLRPEFDVCGQILKFFYIRMFPGHGLSPSTGDDVAGGGFIFLPD